MPFNRIAVVSGSNRGIGLALVKAFCNKFDGDVCLTSRSVEKGMKVVEKLRLEGLRLVFHQLDINDYESVSKLKADMVKSYGGIDVLVNNAGIAYKMHMNIPFVEHVAPTVQTNYFDTLHMCETLLPIIKSNGRVVNISSSLGARCLPQCSQEVQKFFRDPELTLEALNKKMHEYVELSQKGLNEDQGFPSSEFPNAYAVSKIGLTAATKVLGMTLQREKSSVLINSCCPGWVRTDMGGPRASKSVEEGIVTPLYLSLLPLGSFEPQGEYVTKNKVQCW